LPLKKKNLTLTSFLLLFAELFFDTGLAQAGLKLVILLAHHLSTGITGMHQYFQNFL
jgi:hypothetical protein